MDQKYEFTGETMEWYGRTLRRIRATCDIPYTAKAGDLGGWVEDETNLSRWGSAWVYRNAKVYEDAKIYDGVKVFGNAEVFGCAKIYGNVSVYGNAAVFGYTTAHDNAVICGNAEIYGNAKLRDGKVETTQSYICLGPVGSRDAYVTLNLTSGTVCTGCFNGTIDEFEAAVKKRHVDNEHAANYADVINYFRARMAHNQTSPATD